MSNYSDRAFPVKPAFGPPAPPQRNWLPCCLVGCLVIGVLGLLSCGGIAWYLAKNVKSIASDVARQAIVSTIEQSELDPAEKQALIAEVDRVVDQYRSGKITLEDLGRILDELAKSPVMQNIVIYAIERQYVDPSGLPDEEKQAAHLTLQRILRGIHEKRIELGDLDTALDHLSSKTQDGQRQIKDRVTDEELRKFLAECRRVADRAGVPVEPFEIKISEEFRKAVERVMPSLPKPEASASGNVSSKPEASANGGAPPKPAASAGGDAPRPSSPDPATMPLEREEPTNDP